jgi:hypothetical protein
MRLKYVLSAGFVVALAGCASAPNARTSTATTQAPACVPTGSRLTTANSGQHCGVSGRTYSGDDLQRTGEDQVGDALQKLDPSITVHR